MSAIARNFDDLESKHRSELPIRLRVNGQILLIDNR
jgi:hypothetical protein